MNKLTTFSSDKEIESTDSQAMQVLQAQLDNTKIDNGFFEILNGGWQKQSEMTLPFEVDATKVQHKLSRVMGGDVDLYSEEGKLKFRRSDGGSDEVAVLHGMKEYEAVQKRVWK